MLKIAMPTVIREKFSSQAAPDVLAALRDSIEQQQKECPCRHVMTAFASSVNEFDDLYSELAK